MMNETAEASEKTLAAALPEDPVPEKRPCSVCAPASAGFFLAGLSGCLFYAVCYLLGRSFYIHCSLLLFQQCLFGGLFGIAGILFYFSGAGLRMWGSALLTAGLFPFVSWLVQAPGSAFLELNAWLLVIAMPVMLDSYVSFLLDLAGRMGLAGKRLEKFLGCQKRMVLYTAVVPFVAFAGSCLLSRDFVFQGLLQQVFGGEYWVISRYLVAVIGLDLLIPAVDSLWFFYEIARRHERVIEK